MSDAEIPVRALRNDVSSILRRVELGESFDITRHGRRIARLSPAPIQKRPGTIADLIALRGAVPADPVWAAEIRAMRDADAALPDRLERIERLLDDRERPG